MGQSVISLFLFFIHHFSVIGIHTHAIISHREVYCAGLEFGLQFLLEQTETIWPMFLSKIPILLELSLGMVLIITDTNPGTTAPKSRPVPVH